MTQYLDRLKCPSCGEVIPVSEALYHQIAEKTREELKADLAKQQKSFAAKERALSQREVALEATIESRLEECRQEAVEQARAALGLELEDLKRQAAEKDAELAEAR